MDNDVDLNDLSTIDLNSVKLWMLTKEYQSTTIKTTMSYLTRYYQVLTTNNIKALESLTPDIRTHVIKALIILSKYLGCYPQFKQQLQLQHKDVQR